MQLKYLLSNLRRMIGRSQCVIASCLQITIVNLAGKHLTICLILKFGYCSADVDVIKRQSADDRESNEHIAKGVKLLAYYTCEVRDS